MAPSLGRTITSATAAGCTVTVTFADLPSENAVTTASPTPIPVTDPFGVTVATAASLVDQDTDASSTSPPQELRGTASSWRDSPTATEGSSGVSSTLATT